MVQKVLHRNLPGTLQPTKRNNSELQSSCRRHSGSWSVFALLQITFAFSHFEFVAGVTGMGRVNGKTKSKNALATYVGVPSSR